MGVGGCKRLQNLFQAQKNFLSFWRNMVLADYVGMGVGCAEIVFFFYRQVIFI